MTKNVLLRLTPENKDKLDELTTKYCEDRKLNDSLKRNKYLNSLISQTHKKVIENS